MTVLIELIWTCALTSDPSAQTWKRVTFILYFRCSRNKNVLVFAPEHFFLLCISGIFFCCCCCLEIIPNLKSLLLHPSCTLLPPHPPRDQPSIIPSRNTPPHLVLICKLKPHSRSDGVQLEKRPETINEKLQISCFFFLFSCLTKFRLYPPSCMRLWHDRRVCMAV